MITNELYHRLRRKSSGNIDFIERIGVCGFEVANCGFRSKRESFPADIATFNAQYPKLAVRYSEAFHDRFLIIDDKDVYLIGASLKDLGRKCFAFMKLDSGEIPCIKKTAFAAP